MTTTSTYDPFSFRLTRERAEREISGEAVAIQQLACAYGAAGKLMVRVLRWLICAFLGVVPVQGYAQELALLPDEVQLVRMGFEGLAGFIPLEVFRLYFDAPGARLSLVLSMSEHDSFSPVARRTAVEGVLAQVEDLILMFEGKLNILFPGTKLDISLLTSEYDHAVPQCGSMQLLLPLRGRVLFIPSIHVGHPHSMLASATMIQRTMRDVVGRSWRLRLTPARPGMGAELPLFRGLECAAPMLLASEHSVNSCCDLRMVLYPHITVILGSETEVPSGTYSVAHLHIVLRLRARSR